MKFEWDDSKNILNIRKHGISFEEAVYVFSDYEAISIPDDEHSEYEDRWIIIGKIINHGVIVVVHTERIRGESEYIRIISARKSDKHEEKQYIERLGGN